MKASRVQGVLLELGQQSFDVTTRALVVGDAATPLGHCDMVVVSDPVQVAEVDTSTPVGVETASAQVAERALKHGAVVVLAGPLADPMMLFTISEADAAVVVQLPHGETTDPVPFLAERVAWAKAAGIPAAKIVVESPLASASAVTHLGVPVMVSFAESQGAGAQVAALMDGARLLRPIANHRSAQRTAFTTGELLARRGLTSPRPVEVGAT